MAKIFKAYRHQMMNSEWRMLQCRYQ